jgi:hypothetical protein
MSFFEPGHSLIDAYMGSRCWLTKRL